MLKKMVFSSEKSFEATEADVLLAASESPDEGDEGDEGNEGDGDVEDEEPIDADIPDESLLDFEAAERSHQEEVSREKALRAKHGAAGLKRKLPPIAAPRIVPKKKKLQVPMLARRPKPSPDAGAAALVKVANALAKLAEVTAKPAKAPGPPLTHLEKHLTLLDSALRGKKYVNPCAYSSAHLRNVEMKGAASTKTRLHVVDGSIVADDGTTEDTTGASNSLATLKEGLSFIAQRLMKEPEFSVDMSVGLDRFAFLNWVEQDFVHAASGDRVAVLLEFIRRASPFKYWMPEIMKQNTLLFRAFTGPPAHAHHQASTGISGTTDASTTPPRARSTRGRGGRGRGASSRGRGGAGRGGASQVHGGARASKFTPDQRTSNGSCPSRATKDGVCPSDSEPWNCRFSHVCPRCKTARHRAIHCSRLQ